MHIQRIQVEEGFLDGLDLSFTPGLNVIIGERGTGKTSLIELVRFCLDVRGYTSDLDKQSRQHALSVLGSGRIVVTLSDNEREIVVSRAANDDLPRKSGPFLQPIILSQSEIEKVGLQAEGRTRLLDSFCQRRYQANGDEPKASAEVRSLTTEADAQRREIDELMAQIDEIPHLQKLISQLEPEEQKLGRLSNDAGKKKKQLDDLSVRISESTVRIDAIDRFNSSVKKWHNNLQSLITDQPSLAEAAESEDSLKDCRKRIEHALHHLLQANIELQNAMDESQTLQQSVRNSRQEIEGVARKLRQDIEKLQAGAGTITRQGQQLRERKAQLESLAHVLEEKRKKLRAVLDQREIALDRLDSVRNNRFNARKSAAEQLTSTLGPRIRVNVTRSGLNQTFESAIAEALRGSGLRYSELSRRLASIVSPRQLLQATDANDFTSLARNTGIAEERIVRTLSHFREFGVGKLATVPIEDHVNFEFHDKTDIKDITDLSTGQRCTVVLPIVLQHRERVLIVDQPEDHIDNAFIVETLISSLLSRQNHDQIIFSTHNANIPVLGEADLIVQLGSDGKRGYSILAADLEDINVINAIMTVMEGGMEAFERRAKFYDHKERC